MRITPTTYPLLIKETTHMNPLYFHHIPQKSLTNNYNNIYTYIIITTT